mmetsp:Transcript_91449/g.255442  ORF Transcript_91449/g.255442 Transcript_91449/m.255442 type:complete len:414 (-) Transcript_91449:167-1408(-)
MQDAAAMRLLRGGIAGAGRHAKVGPPALGRDIADAGARQRGIDGRGDVVQALHRGHAAGPLRRRAAHVRGRHVLRDVSVRRGGRPEKRVVAGDAQGHGVALAEARGAAERRRRERPGREVLAGQVVAEGCAERGGEGHELWGRAVAAGAPPLNAAGAALEGGPDRQRQPAAGQGPPLRQLDEASATARVGIDVSHGLVHVREAHPMRRVLEAGHVQHQDLVAASVVAADGRVMAVPRLQQLLARVRHDKNLKAVHLLFGGAAGGLGHDLLHEPAKVCEARARLVHAVRLGVEAVATREADEAGPSDALGLDHLQGVATIQHALVVPPPRPLPSLARVDVHGVEGHAEGAQPAEGGLALGVELLDQPEEAAQGAICQGLSKEAAALARGELHGGARQRAAVERRRLLRLHLGLG